MFWLLVFYKSMRQRLSRFDPVSKFLCVKGIIFFAFWQRMSIAALQQMGLITLSVQSDTTRTDGIMLNDWLVCVEMVFFAVAHRYAFSVSKFAEISERQTIPLIESLHKVLNVEDVIKDTHKILSDKADDSTITEMSNRSTQPIPNGGPDDDEETGLLSRS